jgi:hypothetical protein
MDSTPTTRPSRLRRKIPLASIEAAAKIRPEGYRERILAFGQVKDGYLWLTLNDFIKARRADLVPMLGDKVAAVLKPIVRKADRVLGTQFEDCSGCGERQGGLNKIEKKARKMLSRHNDET